MPHHNLNEAYYSMAVKRRHILADFKSQGRL